MNDVDRFALLYGGVEDVVDALMAPQPVEIKFSGGASAIYKNHIVAGFLAGYPSFQTEGYRELLRALGKLRERVAHPQATRDETSITTVVASLRRFRECTQYLTDPPSNERAVQDIIWIMLRAQFDRVEREETLPRFGIKAYRPDFGIAELGLLVEVKFIGSGSSVGAMQDQLLADVRGYFEGNARYSTIVLFVYDHAHKLRDAVRFVSDLRQLEEVADVIVVPGVAAV